jgi:hypothetical protein
MSVRAFRMTFHIAFRLLGAGLLLPLAGGLSMSGCYTSAPPRTDAVPSPTPISLRIPLPDAALPIGDSVLTAAVMRFFPRLEQLYPGEKVTAWVLADGAGEPQ